MALDLQLSWHVLRAAATPPLDRRGHAAAILDDQWILIHGGNTASGVVSDLFALNIASGLQLFNARYSSSQKSHPG